MQNEEKGSRKPMPKWLHLIMMLLTDVLLLIPIALLLFYFGRVIEKKRAEQESEPSVSWVQPKEINYTIEGVTIA